MTIRSFRAVFDLERRLFKIDRWRLPMPYGVPLLGLAYAACALVAVLLVGRLPVAGEVVQTLPPPVRLLILPVTAAYLLNQLRVDGRAAHAVAKSWLRFRAAPKRLSAFRPTPTPGSTVRFGQVGFFPDERAARYRRAKVAGPAEVVLRYPASAERRRSTVFIEQSSGRPMWRGKRIALKRGQWLVFR